MGIGRRASWFKRKGWIVTVGGSERFSLPMNRSKIWWGDTLWSPNFSLNCPACVDWASGNAGFLDSPFFPLRLLLQFDHFVVSSGLHRVSPHHHRFTLHIHIYTLEVFALHKQSARRYRRSVTVALKYRRSGRFGTVARGFTVSRGRGRIGSPGCGSCRQLFPAGHSPI